jgi:hypothetical protein
MATRPVLFGITAINAVLVAVHLARGGLASAASVPETLRARVIELVDQDGRVRAQLRVEADGEAVLRLRGPGGEVRVKLGAGSDGSGLLLLDGSTEPGIHMLAKGAATSVTLSSRSGRRVITPQD